MSRTPSSGHHPPRPALRQAFGNDLLGAALLSGVAGYVDTAGFLALYGLLTAHVTGDLVTAGAVVVENMKTGAATRLSMIPIFMMAVAATALFARRYKRAGREPLAALLALMTVALAVFGVTGVALHRWAVAPDDWAVALIGATGVVAMAIQNTLMRDALSTFCPTTIMTGNLTQVTIDLVDIVLPPTLATPQLTVKHRADARRRLRRFGYPLVGFTVGAGFGALLTHSLGLWSIALPTAVVGSLTVVAWDVERSAATPSVASAASVAVASHAPRSLAALATAQAPGLAHPPSPPTALRSDPHVHDALDHGPLSSAGGRRASGTRLAAMQVDDVAQPDTKESGTYLTAGSVSAEASSSSHTSQDRRRARS